MFVRTRGSSGGVTVNSLMVFNNSLFGDIRMIDIDGKPHFVGVDVARALKYAKPSQAVIDHCKGIRKLGIPSDGGTQETNVITEGDLYRLVVKASEQSRSETVRDNALRFESWIFDDVLPSARKNGSYGTPRELSRLELIDLARESELARLDAEKKSAELEYQLRVQQPKVVFADAVTVSQNTILIRELAVILKQNGIEIGEKRLFEQLRNMGYLIKRAGTDRNTPTQRAMELGLFEIKETPIVHANGTVTVSKTTKVTGKGQVYFVNKFKAQHALEPVEV